MSSQLKDKLDAATLPLEQEVLTFARHREELLSAHHGEYVLIIDDKFLGTFPLYEDALRQGYRQTVDRPFLVKKILEFERTNFFLARFFREKDAFLCIP